MIRFEGAISQTSKKIVLKSYSNLMLIISICVCIPFVIVNILVAIFIDSIYALFLLAILSLPVIAFFAREPKKAYGMIMPEKIIIDEECIESEGERFHKSKLLSDVKKIVDYGDGYLIFFYSFPKTVSFFCQKNLIVEGTIEEFEKLFEDKIVRK